MPSRRLIAPEHSDRWAADLSAAMAKASDRMRRTVASALAANGLDWDSPARSSPANLFDPASWAQAVNIEVAPVAQRIATEVWGQARAKIPARATVGAPNPVDQLAAMIVNRALQGGSGISRRLGTLSVTAAGVDIASVLEKVNAAEALPLHEGNQPTVGTAYQQAFAALDEVVANTGAHLSDAAAAILGETAAASTGASVTHVWRSAFAPTSREAHMEADGDEQNAGDPFTVDGEDLMFPGDPSGSDGNTISCMCWLDTNVLDAVGEVGAEGEDVA